jgi:hypothetical protein
MKLVTDSLSHSFVRSRYGLLITSFILLACARMAFIAQGLSAQPAPGNHLLIYAIDVEGGQSTLLVDTATRSSLLVDTGWPSEKVQAHRMIEAAAMLRASRRPCKTQESPRLTMC